MRTKPNIGCLINSGLLQTDCIWFTTRIASFCCLKTLMIKFLIVCLDGLKNRLYTKYIMYLYDFFSHFLIVNWLDRWTDGRTLHPCILNGINLIILSKIASLILNVRPNRRTHRWVGSFMSHWFCRRRLHVDVNYCLLSFLITSL